MIANIPKQKIEYLNTIQPGVESSEDPNVYLWFKGGDNSQLHLTGRINSTIPTAVISYFQTQNAKELYYLTAIKNLFKKNSYLQLSLDLAHGYITAEEFREEIKKNRSKYVVSLVNLHGSGNLHIIAELLAKITEEELSIDDVGELFSITPNSLANELKALNP